jgi:uncharacterized metal-binding protein YceD (DUF177 family)
MRRGLRQGGLDCCVGRSSKVDIGGVLATGRPLAVDMQVEVPSFGSHTFTLPARARLELRRVDRGLGITGTVEAQSTGSCDRCLADTTRTITVDVDECITSNGSEEGAFAESNVLESGLLDVADLARQVIDSALPMVLLCSDDCPGMCPSCGLSRREGACACPVTVER